MRDILFRAKSINDNKWQQGYLYRIWENAYICWGMVNDIPAMKEINPKTVCEYTGLLDKNKRQIFERDIVTIDSEKGNFVVEWDPNYARFMLLGNDNTVYFDSCWNNEIQVIGNIFDNSELLVGERECEREICLDYL